MRAALLLAALSAAPAALASHSLSAAASAAQLERRIQTAPSDCGLSASKHQLYRNPLKGNCVAHCPFGYYGVEQTKTCTKCASVFGKVVKTCDKDGAKSCSDDANGVSFVLEARQCVCPSGTTLTAGACISPVTTTTTSAAATTTTTTTTPVTTTTTGTTTSPATSSTSTATTTPTTTPPCTATSTTTTSSSTTTTTSSTTTTTTASSTTTTTTTSTTTSSTTTTSAAAASPTPRLVEGWSYQGCWRDLAFDGRVLPNGLTSKASYTVESCLAACASKGYAICGLEYKGECWGAPGVPRWTEPVNECTLPCKNDPTALCGGNAALTVYVSESIPWVQPVPNEELASYSGYDYQSCHSDLVVNQARVLPRQHTNTEGRVESCLEFCASKNAPYCGLEYYGECWYALPGETLAPASQLVAEELCRFSCRGAPYEDCGGKASLSLWKLAEAPPPAIVTYRA